ncbi:MAG: RluA family pseudouridine synthase [Deltaproteobacteria bacterium]|nr:RluA family pseudouridine synthase [Deltaproteobacteria bacterium]
MMEDRTLCFEAGDEDGELRLDLFLSGRMKGFSRSQIQKMIEDGLVLLNGGAAPPSRKVKTGSTITVSVPRPAEYEAVPQDLPLEVLYEDSDILVINKSAGMVVHPGAGNPDGTVVNAVLSRCKDLSGIGGVLRPGIVHRLDKETSGVLLVAKNDSAHQNLGDQFKRRGVNKEYIAIALNPEIPDKGKFATKFGRSRNDRVKFSSRVRAGKEAVTEYEVLARSKTAALILVKPKTGRTHQIRVHLCESGHPIAGDKLYGRSYPKTSPENTDEIAALKSLARHALHAYYISFIHPRTGRLKEFKAPIPEDMRSVIKALFEIELQ